MEKIIIEVEPSMSQNEFEIDLEDLNLTKEGWDKMSKEEKTEKLQEFIAHNREQPSWIVDRFYWE